MTDISTAQLIEAAFEARTQAYAPYSDFYVGAALLTADGKVYTGCNVENAAYPATICAEQVAAAKAISEGSREFVAIAVCGGAKDKGRGEVAHVFPCGTCRQVLAEFALADFKVYSAISQTEYQTYALSELLPQAFTAAQQKHIQV